MLRLHALGLIAMGTVMSIMVTSPVISLYLDRLGLPPQHVGALVGATSLAIIVTELLAMGVSRALGRRGTVVVSLVGAAAMFAAFPFARSLPGLYLMRLGLGAVRGPLWPVLFAEVAEYGPPERRGTTFAVFWLYFGIAQLFAPALGGWLGQQVSLSAPFYAGAALSLLTVGAGFAMGRQHDPSPRNPLATYRTLLRRAPSVGRAWMLTVLNTTVFGVYVTFMPLHAAARGAGAAQIGLIFTGAALAFTLTQWTLARLAARISPERLLAPAFLARGLSVAVVPLLGSFRALLAVNVAGSIAGTPVPSAVSMRISARTPRELLVPAMGGFNAAADLGFFIGPVAGGLLAVQGLQWPFLMVLPATASALLLLRLPERTPRQVGGALGDEPVGDHRAE